MIKIAVDAFGGDNAPYPMVEGAVSAVQQNSDLHIVLTGDADKINEVLKPLYNQDRITVFDAKEVITNEDVPTRAIKTKQNSSMVAALKLVADGECDGIVSAGSTGALLTGAFMIVRRIKGIQRPVLCCVTPKVGAEGKCLFLDCGANSECKPSMLQQFALMGCAYSKAVLGVEEPKVALLSNGTEEGKGNDMTKEAFAFLKSSDMCFTGNIEARDILTAGNDVVVTDGWTGNIALKAYEGMANCIFAILKDSIKTGGFKAKLGAVLLRSSLRKVKRTLDYSELGGGIFLGVEKPVIKAHGSSVSRTVAIAIAQAADMVENKVIDKIKSALPEEAVEED